ncbi:carbohydrate ABC transporter permease [Lachnoclostridium sp. Marseille-P6806]|uniref:carbohydrate ABC transporter permease n=1 Tax=Lachnoclostridium sp. Marseille-P6806 TaxID=2364793 RepID=UPI001031520E|nr:carbohydrate ABC transporter permease [Lachnoclostridium sp. Marseille-P6806]
MRTKEQIRFEIIGNMIMILLTLTALIPILRSYGMSFIITGIGTACALFLTTTLAYGLSKKDLPFRGALTFLVFFTMLFNGGLVPTYINYTNMFHIKDTIFGLLIPSLMMNAFNVLLMKSYFTASVPDEIMEAAYIDGAGEVTTMVKIALPLSRPIMATIAMFAGLAYWNNGYIYIVKHTELFTIQNLLNRLMQNIQALAQNANNISGAQQGLAQIPTSTVRMAMATLGILPVIVVYPFIQKNFVKGITLEGVKG